MAKKAQGGMNAAVLVAVIAGLIIIYILFLPVEEREKLLDEENGDNNGDSGDREETVLLLEHPGRLDTIGKIDDRFIPNVFITEIQNAQELEKLNPFTIRNGWFDKRDRTLRFTLENTDLTDNVLLVFSVSEGKGVLSIELNGENVYEFEPSTVNVGPIKLKKELLLQENELRFSVSSVGPKFWSTNEYSLEDIRIIGDITDTSRQESQNVFELTSTEFANLDKATLRFVAYCSSVRNVGKLDVSVNNRMVFSGVPVCDDPVQPIPILGALSAGENKVVFRTDSGSYSIEQIKVDMEIKDTPTVVYFFEVTDAQLEDVRADRVDANLTIEFVDDDKQKKADININRHLTSIEQDKPIYSKKINNWIEPDNNYIEIRPRNEITIVDVKVALVD
ncbi:hypothetical protein J4453_03700 [Candidatus Woesearchaeota archaeon]|nr:hypothetical protein [Candidatus Woesearchaeota archaeon]